MRLASLLLSLTVALGLSTQAGSVLAEPEVVKPIVAAEVIRAEFGLFFPPESGKQPFVPTRTVPFIENQGYGWLVFVKPNPGKVRWREEFVLPAPPSTWGDAASDVRQDVSTDRRTSVKEGQASAEQGVILNAWSVAPGDPKGKYVIRVYIEGKLVQAFDFEVR